MKLKERFVITSKEDALKNVLLRRVITLTVLFSAVIVPFLNDGVLYTIVEYTSYDAALVTLNLILRYIIVFLRYICTFVSFAAVFTGIMHYGYRDFKTPSVIFFFGSFVQFMLGRFGSFVFCYEHGLVSFDVTDVATTGFTYFFQGTFDLVKNIVLVVICAAFAKKIKKGMTDHVIPDERAKASGFRQLLRTAFKRSDPFLKMCGYAAGIQALHDILSNFFSVTLFQLITDGLPETGLNYAALLSGYALIIPLCAAGFILSVLLCVKLSYMKPAPKT